MLHHKDCSNGAPNVDRSRDALEKTQYVVIVP